MLTLTYMTIAILTAPLVYCRGSSPYQPTRRNSMDSVNDLVDDAHKTYGRIDDFVTALARGRATWVTRGRVQLESRA
jgi:hypothetical protein